MITRASLIVAALALAILLPSLASFAADEPAALWNWEKADTLFRQAGEMIGDGKYDEAVRFLKKGVSDLPSEYGEILSNPILIDLESALEEHEPYEKFTDLSEACNDLNAFPAAIALARKAKAVERKDERDRFALSHHLAWALAQTGKLGEAKAELAGTQGSVGDWSSDVSSLIDDLRSRPDSANDPKWVADHIDNYPSGGLDTPRYMNMLRELKSVLGLKMDAQLRQRLYWQVIRCLKGLHDTEGVRAWEDKLMQDFPADRELAAVILAGRADELYWQKKFEPALAICNRIITDYAETAKSCHAQRLIGDILAMVGKTDEAVAAYRQVLIMADKHSTNQILGGRANTGDAAMEMVQALNGTGRYAVAFDAGLAAWGIAEALYAKEDYTGAVEAYAVCEKYPRPSSCGTGFGEVRFERSFKEAACRERLGQYPEATKAYARAALDGSGYLAGNSWAHVRLVQLYEASGQLDTLRNYADDWETRHEEKCVGDTRKSLEEDAATRKVTVPQGWEEDARKLARKYTPVRPIWDLLELRDWEKQQDWAKIVRAAAPPRGSPEALRENVRPWWYRSEAWNIIRRNRTEIAGLLTQALKESDVPNAHITRGSNDREMEPSFPPIPAGLKLPETLDIPVE